MVVVARLAPVQHTTAALFRPDWAQQCISIMYRVLTQPGSTTTPTSGGGADDRFRYGRTRSERMTRYAVLGAWDLGAYELPLGHGAYCTTAYAARATERWFPLRRAIRDLKVKRACINNEEHRVQNDGRTRTPRTHGVSVFTVATSWRQNENVAHQYEYNHISSDDDRSTILANEARGRGIIKFYYYCYLLLILLRWLLRQLGDESFRVCARTVRLRWSPSQHARVQSVIPPVLAR